LSQKFIENRGLPRIKAFGRAALLGGLLLEFIGEPGRKRRRKFFVLPRLASLTRLR
jgi:hypothetical protein